MKTAASIENNLVKFNFLNSGSLAAILDLEKSEKLEFDAKKVSLWRIVFRKSDGTFTELYANELPEPVISETSGGIDILWKPEQHNVELKASILLSDNSKIAEWGLDVKNNTGMGIWEVQYPVIGGITYLSGSGEDDRMVLPWQYGVEIPNPVDVVNKGGARKREWITEYAQCDTDEGTNKIAFSYPGMWAIQMMALYNTGQAKPGIYFASHDGEARMKRFGIYKLTGKTMSLIMTNYPDERIDPDVDYSMPYPVKAGIFNGDWLDAAMEYRKWAMNQKWCAKGKTRERQDIPQWLKDNDFWLWNWSTHMKDHFNSMPELFAPMAVALKKELDCNMAVHWYGSTCEPFNMRNPELFPISPSAESKLKSGLDLLHANNIKAIPYMNPRLCDQLAETWAKHNVEPMSCLTHDGKIHEEVYIEDKAWITICPSQKRWHDVIFKIIEDCMEHEYDGAYIDQVSSAYIVPCFSGEHGHSKGGGDNWCAGYRDMIAGIQKRFKTETSCFTSESTVECYNDLFDANLARSASRITFDLLVKNDVLIPLCNSIYHDYIITYGSTILLKTDNPDCVYMAGAMTLASGNQLSFECSTWADVKKGKFKDYIDYFRNLCAFRKKYRGYFNFGEWVRSPEVEADKVVLNISALKPECEVPAVLSGAWKLNNKILYYFVNHTNEDRKIICNINNIKKEIIVSAKNATGFEA